MATRAQIVDAARAYLGVKWVHQGRTAHGVDCIGLLLRAGWDAGLELPDFPNYTRTPVPATFVKAIQDHTVAIPRLPLKHGAVAIFRQSHLPCHVGLIALDRGEPTLIHSLLLSPRKVVEMRFRGSEWERDLIEFRDYPGLED